MRIRALPLPVFALLTCTFTAVAIDQLRVRDPKAWWRYGQGTVEKSVVSVRPVGVYMEYGIYLTFSARGLGYPHYDSMEVRCDGQAAGTRTIQFDAAQLPSGVYVYRIQAGHYSATRKLLLIK